MTKGSKRRFKPTFWATFFAIPTFLLMIGLGTWQVQRLNWKEEQIALRQARATADAVSFAESYPGGVDDPAAEEFRKVWVEGTFLHDKEMYIGARAKNRRLGKHVVTPFVLRDGRQILIDRGWVPSEKADPATRSEGQLPGTVLVEGLIRVGGWKGYDFIRPDNDTENNFWFYVDIPAMADWADLENPISDVYLDAGPAENPGGWPQGGQTRIQLTNNHLEYVITWYSMALILAVIYFLFHYRREEEDGEDKAQGED